MSSNRLMYDTCAYKKRLDESVGPLNYTLYPGKYENCSKCRIELGSVGGNNVSLFSGNLVDLESELRGQNHVIYRCPEKKHQMENNGISKPYVKVEQKFCKGAKEVKTKFSSLKDCQMVDFRNVAMDGCPNV